MKRLGILLAVILFAVPVSFAQKQVAADLEQNFKNPPQSAKPRTWMHGNMSEVGLTKDLEAMADAGIGGIILFNVIHVIPKGKTIFNSPEHIEKTAYAAAECERLGLSFYIYFDRFE